MTASLKIKREIIINVRPPVVNRIISRWTGESISVSLYLEMFGVLSKCFARTTLLYIIRSEVRNRTRVGLRRLPQQFTRPSIGHTA